jgi:hypothetical protein
LPAEGSLRRLPALDKSRQKSCLARWRPHSGRKRAWTSRTRPTLQNNRTKSETTIVCSRTPKFQ